MGSDYRKFNMMYLKLDPFSENRELRVTVLPPMTCLYILEGKF